MSDSAGKLDAQNVVIVSHDTDLSGKVLIPLTRALISAGARPVIIMIVESRGRDFGVHSTLMDVQGKYDLHEVSSHVDEPEVSSVTSKIHKALGSVKVLINLAFYSRNDRVTEAGLDLHYRLNFLAPVLCTYSLMPVLAQATPAVVLSVTSGHSEHSGLMSEDEYLKMAEAGEYDPSDALGMSQCALAAFTLSSQSMFSERGIYFLNVNVGNLPGLPDDEGPRSDPARAVELIMRGASTPSLSRGNHQMLFSAGSLAASKNSDLQEANAKQQRFMYELALKQLGGLSEDPLERDADSGEGFFDMFTGCCGTSR